MTHTNQRLIVLTQDHLTGVRSRRIFAICLDLVFIGALSLMAFLFLLLLGFLTFGLSWLLIPVLLPIIAFFYNGMTVSGANMATWGMRMMDLEVRMMQGGGRVPFINAALHALLFYVSCSVLSPAIVAVSLFTSDKRCLHDIFSGVIVMRRCS